jgi:hypothetical protein
MVYTIGLDSAVTMFDSVAPSSGRQWLYLVYPRFYEGRDGPFLASTKNGAYTGEREHSDRPIVNAPIADGSWSAATLAG